ncbi:hypothetical protein DMH18_15960 [Streptomyces sp. WAC 06783]|uniref:hypothetical protein n=1 Tax=Streptomyces sp. WAC 06783 TaxID=2203211 RepID=UPI000F749A5E|nr:hypothetical protein [Streptomyces sp. WAC 06783]RSO09645.1 hypothetical protein DMH18_15960 [Streptomyces sp. WAC 06783]
MSTIYMLGETEVEVLLCSVRGHRPLSRDALRTPGRPPVTVVLDRTDDVRFTRTALCSHDPSAGRVVVHPTVPGGKRLARHDILTALESVPPGRRPAHRTAAAALSDAAYAAAREWPGGQLTLLRAHLMTGGWEALIHVHRTTRVDVVLVHHAELSADLEHLLQHCDHRIIDTLEAMQALHPPVSGGPGPTLPPRPRTTRDGPG